MNTKLGCLFAFILVAGCGGSSAPAPAMYECSAGLNAATYNYVITGSTVLLGTAPNQLQLTLVSPGATSDLPIYGVWGQAASTDSDGVTSSAQFDFEAGSAKFTVDCSVVGRPPVSPSVISTASFTSTTVTINQTLEDDLTF